MDVNKTLSRGFGGYKAYFEALALVRPNGEILDGAIDSGNSGSSAHFPSRRFQSLWEHKNKRHHNICKENWGTLSVPDDDLSTSIHLFILQKFSARDSGEVT